MLYPWKIPTMAAKVERAIDYHRQSTPVWIPRNGKDSNGVPFIVLTCTHCLRSFPFSVKRENVREIQETPCLFCAQAVRTSSIFLSTWLLQT